MKYRNLWGSQYARSQFEDVVTQVVDYSNGHVGRLNGLASRLQQTVIDIRNQHGSEGLLDLPHMIQNFQNEISSLKSEWGTPLNKAVSQSNMEQGAI